MCEKRKEKKEKKSVFEKKNIEQIIVSKKKTFQLHHRFRV